MTNTNTFTHGVRVLRDELAEHLQRRRDDAQLRRELSGFTSPSEIDDLLATLAGDDSPEAARTRAILLSNRVARTF